MTGFDTVQTIREYFEVVRKELKTPPGQTVQFGIGFIGWITDWMEEHDQPRISAYLDELPAAIWLAFGDDLGKLVHKVKKYESTRKHKTKIFVMVHSLEQALVAANEWKVDVIVVQGVCVGGVMDPFAVSYSL